MEGKTRLSCGLFTVLNKKTNGISLNSIRISKYAYFMAYAFELMLFKTRGHFFPVEVPFFKISGYTAVLAVHGIASLIVMLLWSNRFKKLIYVSVTVMVAGFIPFLFLPYGTPRLIFAMIAYAGLGGCVTAARCGYAFALNNAERLIGMLIMFFFCACIYFLDYIGVEERSAVPLVLTLVLLFAFCFCLLKFKESDLEVKEETTKQDTKGLYCALAYFMAYFAIDGYIWSLVDSTLKTPYLFFVIGMLLAGILFALAFTKLRMNLWHIWNIFLGVAALMALFAMLASAIGTTKPQHFFAGLSLIGWPLSMYMLGCAQRQFASYRLLKQCTVIFVIASPVLNFSDELAEKVAPQFFPAATLIVVILFLLLTLFFSQYSYTYLFSAPWVSNMMKDDMNYVEPEADVFIGYDLTPRQKEVALLLLQAKTRRQIAGELGLSESTVKTHTSELYKKLNINSRAELFKLFGVKENG